MFQKDEKTATLSDLQAWLDQINRSLLGVRWDDHERRRNWNAHKRRVEKLIKEKQS